MRDLLNSKPDITTYLSQQGITKSQLAMLGIQEESLITIKDLTDLVVIFNAMKGDLPAKTYLDQVFLSEEQKSKLNVKKKL
jgi:hypothetical protein